MSFSAFTPGLRLAREFYADVVRPLLDEHVDHAAALLGPGSEVAGFDTQRSTDHDWGPRLWDRPYQVLGAARFGAALRAKIADPRIRRLPLAGAVDQFIDSTDAAGDLRFLRECAAAGLGETGEADGAGETGGAR